ncbi:MAG: motility protein A [Bacteriovoracaceae bacterium]|jgi:chemotaxis protein MotA|nr:motility protein A [Bacteriovoracaceae bacterium]
MDIATIVGALLAVGAVVGAIFAGGDILAFIDVPSIIVVGFGVIGVTFIKWPVEVLKGFIEFTMKAILFSPANPKETIEEIGNLAETARRESVFALEKVPIDDSFLKKAMTLAADNRPPEVINSILKMEIDALEARHNVGQNVLSEMANDGPAMGMIGTLIGLVIMLGNLSDQAAIGPAMAVALLTTFYGACLANIFANPVKTKLIYRSGLEITKMNIIIAGTLGIVAGENPRLIKEKLNSFLPPAERESEDTGGDE